MGDLMLPVRIGIYPSLGNAPVASTLVLASRGSTQSLPSAVSTMTDAIVRAVDKRMEDPPIRMDNVLTASPWPDTLAIGQRGEVFEEQR